MSSDKPIGAIESVTHSDSTLAGYSDALVDDTVVLVDGTSTLIGSTSTPIASIKLKATLPSRTRTDSKVSGRPMTTLKTVRPEANATSTRPLANLTVTRLTPKKRK